MAGGFRALKIWQKGYELVLEVYRFTKAYPPDERFNLTSQTCRSATSIIAQIAESHGRYHFADQVRVLYQARGEIEETRSHLSIAHGLDYLSDTEFERIDAEYEGLAVGLNRYINAIERRNHK